MLKNILIIHLLIIIFLTTGFKPYPSYENQEPNTVKRYYYRDSVVSVEKWYNKNKLLDSTKIYYKTGELDEVFYYKKGRFHGKCYKYNRAGKKVTTWLFDYGKLIRRKDHILVFNKKNEEKVRRLHDSLKVLNKRFSQKPNSKTFIRRAAYRSKLDNKTLALHDNNIIIKRVKKTSKGKETKANKLLGRLYDLRSSIYAYLELDNYSLHYNYKAIESKPDDTRLIYNFAYHLYTSKNPKLAEFYAKKVVDMTANHPFAHKLLACIYIDYEDYEKAKLHLDFAYLKEKVLIKRSNASEERDIRTLNGFILHKLGHSEAGIKELLEAIRLNETNAFAHRNLGVVYFELKQYEQACEYFNKAKTLGYEKLHDRYDLEDYIEKSCNFNREESMVISTSRIIETPFIHPNPVIDFAHIKSKDIDFKAFSFSIFNFESKLIKKGNTETNQVDFSGLLTGLYILKVEHNNMHYSFKVLKK